MPAKTDLLLQTKEKKKKTPVEMAARLADKTECRWIQEKVKGFYQRFYNKKI